VHVRQPTFDQHLARLREHVRIESALEEPDPRRWDRRPTDRQRLQQRIRQEVVDHYHALRDQGLTTAEISQRLQLPPRTLRHYDQVCRPALLCGAPLGRPVARAPLAVRQEILAFVKLTGPGVGVPTLKAQFPGVPRAELAELLQRYRAVWQVRHLQSARVLHWQSPGRVWAADFTECPLLVSDRCSSAYVLAVRDLASGCMLAWEPVPNLTEEVSCAALARLFALHGAPLILKVDNGSAFRAAVFQALLDAWSVIPLYSPPSCPGYNGSIEAAIGSLKTRTKAQAQAQGHDGAWTPTDLSAAQSAANTSHPRRLNGRTPSSVWEARRPITAVERVVFTLTVERERFQVKNELAMDQEVLLDHWRHSAVDRKAIERALVEHGHLLFTRRRIPKRIRKRKVTAVV
jgi:transposase InsO family protein